MNNLYSWLAGLLLATGTAAAQAPTEALRPAQTIALGAHGSLGTTIALSNHNTVLLLTDAESPDMLAQCLAPDGRTLWKTTLTRFGRADYNSFQDGKPLLTIGREASEDRQLQKVKAAANLYPINVFTDGNEVVFAEAIYDDAIRQQGRKGAVKLVEGQLHVQRLDEQGRLTKHLFSPRPAPESKKIKAVTLGRYADAAGYAEVVREVNARLETTTFYTLHYDLKSQATRREPLALPANPEQPGQLSSFKHWYQDWAYLGHRPGQTYFCRRTLVSGSQEKAGRQPLTYQVLIADDHGAATHGGFSTTLDLAKGTRPAHSGYMPSSGELNHIPAYFSQSQGPNWGYVTLDTWATTTGGMGSFYLDYGTGDVLVLGEYGEGDLPEAKELELGGFFMRRYAPGGQALAQAQVPYTEAMRAYKRRASFKSHPNRQTYFHADPLTGGYQFTFSTLAPYGNNETYNLYLDREFNLLRYDHPTDKSKNEPVLTAITFTQPFDLTTNFDSTNDVRVYEHADKSDLPVYTALEKQRRPAGPGMPDYWFHLSPTGPGTGLVVEQPQAIGGSLRVYTF